MKLAILLLLAGFLSGCSEVKSTVRDIGADASTGAKLIKHSTESIACPAGLQQAALDKLFPTLGMGNIDEYLSVWISGNYTQEYWKPKLDEEQATLNRLRVWADKQPRCQREAYLGWIDYYQGDLNSAWRELKFHGTKNEMEAYDRDRDKDQRTARAAEQQYPLADPPEKK